MSGLSRTPGKRVWVYPHRGFESRPLRQEQHKNGPSGPFFVSARVRPSRPRPFQIGVSLATASANHLLPCRPNWM